MTSSSASAEHTSTMLGIGTMEYLILCLSRESPIILTLTVQKILLAVSLVAVAVRARIFISLLIKLRIVPISANILRKLSPL